MSKGLWYYTCVGCGYDLGGLPGDGVCPECGLAIEVTRSGDRLDAAPVGYLLRLKLGARLLCIFVVLGSLLLIAEATLSLSGSSTGNAGIVVGITLAVGLALGLWGVTTPQPGRMRAPVGDQPRRIARLSLLGALGLGAGGYATVVHACGVWTVAVLALFVGHLTLSIYMMAMARRLRDEKMHRWCSCLIWLPFALTFAAIAATCGVNEEALSVFAAAGCVQAAASVHVLTRFRLGLSRAMEAAAEREREKSAGEVAE
ncbi:MAG: hypothetical protein IT438_10230 [Phycisphaerales bacterium]|nr:hypothetical protein [Phycisphaerales bacterium]